MEPAKKNSSVQFFEMHRRRSRKLLSQASEASDSDYPPSLAAREQTVAIQAAEERGDGTTPAALHSTRHRRSDTSMYDRLQKQNARAAFPVTNKPRSDWRHRQRMKTLAPQTAGRYVNPEEQSIRSWPTRSVRKAKEEQTSEQQQVVKERSYIEEIQGQGRRRGGPDSETFLTRRVFLVLGVLFLAGVCTAAAAAPWLMRQFWPSSSLHSIGVAEQWFTAGADDRGQCYTIPGETAVGPAALRVHVARLGEQLLRGLSEGQKLLRSRPRRDAQYHLAQAVIIAMESDARHIADINTWAGAAGSSSPSPAVMLRPDHGALGQYLAPHLACLAAAMGGAHWHWISQWHVSLPLISSSNSSNVSLVGAQQSGDISGRLGGALLAAISIYDDAAMLRQLLMRKEAEGEREREGEGEENAPLCWERVETAAKRLVRVLWAAYDDMRVDRVVEVSAEMERALLWAECEMRRDEVDIWLLDVSCNGPAVKIS